MLAGGVDDLGVDVRHLRRASLVSLRNKRARDAARACSAGLQKRTPSKPEGVPLCGHTEGPWAVSRSILAHMEVAEVPAGVLQPPPAIPCESDLAPRA